MAGKSLMWAPVERERRAASNMTGRYIVTLQKDAHQQVAMRLSQQGMPAATALPEQAEVANAMQAGHHLMLPNVGVAVVDPLPQQETDFRTMMAQDTGVIAVEPERIVRAVQAMSSSDYLRGWRDAVDALSAQLLKEPSTAAAAPAPLITPALATWGLIATKAINSRYSGNGIRIAILDTGLDLSHPDFQGRNVIDKNFVGDQTPFHDGVGHGTHCTGTASGPLHPARGSRFGIAYSATIYAARVLDDTGRGGDFNILQGIDWAISQGCQVISLSLGAPWLPGDPAFSQAYETAAQRALAAGCLLVVAAGNEASNPQYIGAVGTPGNSPSVLTVAAVDQQLATASFSNRIQADAPGVKGPDLAAPGVDIYSSWLVSDGQYNTISGTSMATPHVAGIAALYAEASQSNRGQVLKDVLMQNCAALQNGAARQGETGRGLVQAP